MKKTIRLRADETAPDEGETQAQEKAANEQRQQLAMLPFFALMMFLILCGMGLVELRGGQTRLEHFNLLDAHGLTATGRVTDKTATIGKNERYVLHYTFTDASGAQRESASLVSYNDYQATQTGASVNVIYLADRKDVATLAQSIGKKRAQDDIVVGYLVIGTAFVVGTLLALIPFLLRKKASQSAG